MIMITENLVVDLMIIMIIVTIVIIMMVKVCTWPDKIAMPGRILPISMLATLLHSSLKVSKHSTV